MMKRTTIITASLLLCLLAGAQQYRPMLKDGKQWHCYYTNGQYEMNFNYYLDGDTVVEGEKGYRLYANTVNQWTGETRGGGIVGALAEKDGRVFLYDTQVGRQTLYDMNLKVGDVAHWGGPWTVTDVSTVYAMGVARKRLTLKRAGGDVLYWVEGVGSSWGLDQMAYIPLVSCYEDSRCIFTAKNFEGMPEAPADVERHCPLLSEGNAWWYEDISVPLNDHRKLFRMVVKGDTIIGGRAWKKLYCDYSDSPVPLYEKAVREENGRVYEIRMEATERLLFDYTLGVGGRYAAADRDDRYMEVIAIDTVVSAGMAHRRLILQQYVNNVATDLTCWTEGIGGDCGIDLEALWSDMDAKVVSAHGGTNYYQRSFVGCVGQDGKCFYGDSPAVLSSVAAAVVSKEYSGKSLYDLHGRRLTAAPRKGVYIRDGRKVVVK
jgi:hypothetical protein